MKLLVCLSFVLTSCGSAAEIAAALRETPAPTGTAEPGIVWAATPLPAAPARRNMVDDYQKVEKGMTQEEVVTILGPAHKEDTKTFCDNGKCDSYRYLSWLYADGKIGVTILAGVCTYTYTIGN